MSTQGRVAGKNWPLCVHGFVSKFGTPKHFGLLLSEHQLKWLPKTAPPSCGYIKVCDLHKQPWFANDSYELERLGFRFGSCHDLSRLCPVVVGGFARALAAHGLHGRPPPHPKTGPGSSARGAGIPVHQTHGMSAKLSAGGCTCCK